jgi:hypothetical protein
MKISVVIFAFFITFLSNGLFSQTSLKIIKSKFGKVKQIEIFVNENLEYKLKKEIRYRKNKIVALNDTMIVFDNDSIMPLSRIKLVKIRDHRHLLNLFGGAFKTAGVMFLGLNTINNAINNRSPVIDNKAVGISAALFGTGMIMKYFSAKRIRITKNTIMKVVEINYADLNTKQK